MSIADESAGPILEQRPVRQGRLAYYAYGNMTDGRTADGRAPLPDWDQLADTFRQAWIEAARAVRADTLDPDYAHRTGADNRTAPWLRIEKGHAAKPEQMGGGNYSELSPELDWQTAGIGTEEDPRLPCSECGWAVVLNRHSVANCHANQQRNRANEEPRDG